jgi:hypothetical protein
MNKKKYYTFLLGKITPEKLSNFVDFIDCFILIACPFSDFYNFKTLMKPLVSALDVEIAYNEKYFKWDMSYTFDPKYILKYNKIEYNNDGERNILKLESPTEENAIKFTSLSLKESEKNQALANIFSVKTLENFDKRKFKGLDINLAKKEVEKIRLGKTGIPLKYEDILPNNP